MFGNVAKLAQSACDSKEVTCGRAGDPSPAGPYQRQTQSLLGFGRKRKAYPFIAGSRTILAAVRGCLGRGLTGNVHCSPRRASASSPGYGIGSFLAIYRSSRRSLRVSISGRIIRVRMFRRAGQLMPPVRDREGWLKRLLDHLLLPFNVNARSVPRLLVAIKDVDTSSTVREINATIRSEKGGRGCSRISSVALCNIVCSSTYYTTFVQPCQVKARWKRQCSARRMGLSNN